jgi:mono/diheme cytochrome c family protein
MQFRNFIVRHSQRMLVFAGLISALLLHTVALGAEDNLPGTADPFYPLAAALGVHFVEGSNSSIILEREGKQYVVDLTTRSIHEVVEAPQVASVTAQQPAAAQTSALIGAQTGAGGSSGAAIFKQQCASCHGNDGSGSAANTPDFTNFRARANVPLSRIVDTVTNGRTGRGTMPAFGKSLSAGEINAVASYVQSLSADGAREDIYLPADDLLFSLPTGRKMAPGELYVNFTHRFAYNPAFSGKGLGNTLLGFDGFAVSSFGFRYAATEKLSFSVYRAPSIINRPIEFLMAYNVLDEYEDHPINAALRVSVDGQDNFRKNFTANLEAIVSRSITNKAQFYAVPTLSLGNRRLISKPGALENRPANLDGVDSFSLGAGLAVNVRPTLAVVAEVIPTLVHGRELGIHRPAYGFGIQKQVRGHAFTLGVSNGPGTVVAQRAGTRASFLGDPSADKPRGLFFGFNLMRKLR